MRKVTYCLLTLMIIACETKNSTEPQQKIISFDKISYYRYPKSDNDTAFQSRLTYYFEDGKPHRWMELDSLGRVVTDYIYEYDNDGKHIGARYREDSAADFSVEKVRFENDSTQITEWIDSIGEVYYTMIDNLNKQNKTYRAEFIGDKTHGFDSTFYTKEGFEKRIFFTNTKGKVFNDRSFTYDSINAEGDWVMRKKIMNDTITELQIREVYYDNSMVSKEGTYYEGIVSTGELSENVISFTQDEATLFLTRTSDWTEQSAYIAYLKNGIFPETVPIAELNTIYNGAISPNGDKIIYSLRNGPLEEIWLIKKVDSTWSLKTNLSEISGIQGGYFYWLNDTEIYFQQAKNNGDITVVELTGDRLTIKNNLAVINTEVGTEFSPFVDRAKRFIIFTRYVEGDDANQGFFVSYNEASFDDPKWSNPEKLAMLPYGWSPFVIDDGKRFVYSDGEDFFNIPIEKLDLKLE